MKIGGSRARKISITVDEEVLAGVEAIARREGSALSTAVTAALARDLRRRRLHDIIARYEKRHGEISEKELAKARRAWGA